MEDDPAPDHGADGGDAPVIVLASGSRYRARMLAEAGIPVLVDPPMVDERAFDGLLEVLGPDGLALELAGRKADAVAPRHPGMVVVAADQVGVLDGDDGDPVMLTQQPTVEGAVAQLVRMSGTVHRLVTGVVVQARSGDRHTGVDVQQVAMRAYSEAEALAYVEAYEPFDTAGSYRLEDGESLEREGGVGAALVVAVEGEHPSGVLGLPLPLLRRLLVEAGEVDLLER